MLTHCAIIITKDRPAEIAAMLHSLRAQTRPPDHIIIVDASTAPSASSITGKITGHPSPSWRGAGGEGGVPLADCTAAEDAALTILHTPPNISGQKNAGLDAAQEDIVSFFDDDSEIPSEYCEIVLSRFEADAAHAIVGISGMEAQPLRRPLLERLFRKFFLIQSGAGENRILLSGIPDVGYSPQQEAAVQCCAAGAVSYRRMAVAGIRFDEHGMTGAALGLPTGRGFSEDLLFSIQVGTRGRLIILPSARYHHAPSPHNRENTYVTQALYIHSLRRLSRLLVRGPIARSARIWALAGQGLLCLLQMLVYRNTGYVRGWWRAMTTPID